MVSPKIKPFLFNLVNFLLFQGVQNYISIKLIKFKESIIKDDYSPETFVNSNFNKYYTLINIGNPPQLTEAQLNCGIADLFLSEKICLTEHYFNKNKSISLNQTFINKPKNQFESFKIYSKDTIKFKKYDTNLKDLIEIELNNYTFLYQTENDDVKSLNKNEKGKACASLGLKIMCSSNNFYCRPFLDVLRDNKLINSKNFFINYYKEEINGYDAEIIIGEYPHDLYPSKYNLNKYYRSRADISDIYNIPDWVINFQNYFYNNNGTKINFYLTRIKEYMQVNFTFDIENIIGINEYLYQIKIHYFNNHLDECQINLIQGRYTIITCDINFKENDFPSLYFENIEANYTLELTYRDLFRIRGNKKYFLIIFDKYNIVPWRFGKLFMQKYLFNFEADNKMIGFYIPEEKSEEDRKNIDDEENKNINWILWVCIIIITGIVCFLIGTFFFTKKRKKRANEMDDDNYDYFQESKEEKNKTREKNDNLIIN